MLAPFAALALALVSGLSSAWVPRLVEQLGAPEFAAREAASKKLTAIGEPALPLLKHATQSTDPEVARRANTLVATITKRAENTRLLAPTLVELNVVDQPLGDVLPILEQQTGYKFQVSGVGRALSKKITLSTNGKVPFWVAMDQVSAAAGLSVGSEYQAITALSQELQPLPLRGGRRMPPSAPMQQLIVPTSTVILRPKPAQPNPLALAGAVRLEAIPYPAGAIPTPTPDTATVLLQAIPEPKLPWERVQSYWVTKATDEQGRELATVASADSTVTRIQPIQGGRVVFDAAGNLTVVPDGDRGAPELPFVPNNAQTMIHLKLGESPSRTLKEFEGVIRAVVQSSTEELVATPFGRSAMGHNGVSLKATTPVPADEPLSDAFVCDVSLRYNTTDVRIEGGQPSVMETVWIDGRGRMVNRQQIAAVVLVNGKRVGADARPQRTLFGLTVTDDAGKPYLLAVTQSKREIDQLTLWNTDDVKLILKPSEPGQGKPTKVTFSAGRSKTVDIPFKLRDVPLTMGKTP